jgi:Mitochondrial ribosomal protein (VAR1)
MSLNKQLIQLKKGKADKLNTKIIKYVKYLSKILNLKMNLLTYNNYLNTIKNSKKSILTLKKNSHYPNLITTKLRNNKQIYLQFIRYRNYLNFLSKWPEFNRVGKVGENQNIYDYYTYNKNKNYKNYFLMEIATKFLTLAFLSKDCLISKPKFNIIYTLNSDSLSTNSEFNQSEFLNKNKIQYKKIIQIHLFYYKIYNRNIINKIIINQYDLFFNYLSEYLTKLFKSEIELNLIRLYKPYQNSTILTQYFNSLSYKYKFVRMMGSFYRKSIIFNYRKISSIFIYDNKSVSNLYQKLLSMTKVNYPSGITGINVKLAGRSAIEKIIPRITVKRSNKGSFNRKFVQMTEKAMFTDTSKKGSFNFTISLSHCFRLPQNSSNNFISKKFK